MNSNTAACKRLKQWYFQFDYCKRHVPICLLLHYQEDAGVWMASSNRKDLLSCSWIAEPPSHVMLNTIMQTYFFQWVQRKIMALIYALTSSKCFVCKLGEISGTERLSVSRIHLLLPGGLREICYGLLTWELLIRIETKPCVELD